MKKTYSLRKESRVDYTVTKESLTSEDLRDGALLRIADAVEKIAEKSNYDSMKKEIFSLQEVCDAKQHTIKYLDHQIAGLQGYIKRMKK